jgi:hypothetical protein
MIGLAQSGGDVGKLIQLGQWLNGDGFSTWEHAFVLLPDNKILEAEPGGAVIVPQHHDEVYWCRGIYGKILPPNFKWPVAWPTLDTLAGQLKGTPYSFADYAALTAHRLHVPAPGLQEFIANSGHEICSQLADDYYSKLGGHIFTDKRWPGYVTPGMLWKRDLELRRA